ncbi:MAG: AbgT family transporter [Phocaeicola sp.]
MKSNIRFIHPATLCFLLTLGVVLASWVASMQGVPEVQNLLTADALRWQLRHALPNYMDTPALGIVMILFIGGGLLFHSGWITACKKLCVAYNTVTRKERMGLLFSLLVGVVYMLLVLSITYAPLTLLRSVTGSLHHSPFLQGIYYIVSIGMGMVGIVFGYTSGRMHSDRDIVAGMQLLFVHCADYFVILFFLVQFFSTLQYSSLFGLLGVEKEFVRSVFDALFYLPLLPCALRKIDFN